MAMMCSHSNRDLSKKNDRGGCVRKILLNLIQFVYAAWLAAEIQAFANVVIIELLLGNLPFTHRMTIVIALRATVGTRYEPQTVPTTKNPTERTTPTDDRMKISPIAKLISNKSAQAEEEAILAWVPRIRRYPVVADSTVIYYSRDLSRWDTCISSITPCIHLRRPSSLDPDDRSARRSGACSPPRVSIRIFGVSLPADFNLRVGNRGNPGSPDILLAVCAPLPAGAGSQEEVPNLHVFAVLFAFVDVICVGEHVYKCA
eukprot:817921-Amorphochlora_amoeboformis.AAC.1